MKHPSPGSATRAEVLFYLIAPLLFFVAMNRTRLVIATAFLLTVSVVASSIGDRHGTLDCHLANDSSSYRRARPERPGDPAGAFRRDRARSARCVA